MIHDLHLPKSTIPALSETARREQRKGKGKKRFIMSAQENQQEEKRWFKKKLMSSYVDLL